MAIAREYEVTSLVQQASTARRGGDTARAETLLAQARTLDPENPLVLQHSLASAPSQTRASAAVGPAATPTDPRAIAAGEDRQPAKTAFPAFAGPIRLQPSDATPDLNLRGDSQEVLRQTAGAYGIKTLFDESVERKTLHFELSGQHYQRAMDIAMSMAHVFAVPVDETTILIAKEDPALRLRFEPMVEETLYLSGMTPPQMNDLANIIRGLFGVRQAVLQASGGTMVLRAPAEVIGPINRTLEELLNADSDIMLEVKLYEIDLTHTRNIGATIPTQAGIYSVNAAANQIVSQNQSLVQQAIAQGYVSASASNLQIALALIGLGLVQSSLAASTVGYFGGGLTLTGLTETGSVGFNFGLNQSDTRTLDDVEMHLADGEPGTFRSGTRYPITTSTYTTGLSTSTAGVGSATINGVSVASLLSQYSGGSSTTIPQISYEDLGVTLKATPAIEKSGRVNLKLDMKIQALAGGSLDGNPILANRQIVSTISVNDGDTALLVSSMSRSESAAVSGIPGLSELPGFQVPLDRNVQRDTGQLVVLITPHVVKRRSYLLAGPKIPVHVHEDSPGGGPVMP
ncbi:MAG: hypothetical protein M3O02_00075 [Acidobacteriota bacterium]|nr:hypothetical protein [Acidobacteriota bacterium]